MTQAATVAVLPVGEFDSESVRIEFDARMSVLSRLSARLTVAEPASDRDAAQQAARALADGLPDVLVIVALRGLSAEAQEAAARLRPVPCLFWPVGGRYALPSSALAVGALRESGAPVQLLHGPPDHPITLEKLSRFIRAATAYTRLRRSRIGVIGGLFPNLVACRYDPQTVTSRLGPTLIPLPYNTLRGSMQLAAHNSTELENARQQINESFAVDTADAGALGPGLQLHLALKQIAREQKIDGFAAECWSGLPGELGLNPCLGFAEDAYALACEGDVVLCVSLLLVRALTGTCAYVGDLYDLDLDGNLTLIHCGGPASLAANKREVVLGKSQLALERGFETVTCRPRLSPGPVTLFRLYGRECDRLHLAAGELLDCEQSPNLTVKLKINGNRWEFLEQCFGNHYIVVAGDIRADLFLLAKWLRITIHET